MNSYCVYVRGELKYQLGAVDAHRAFLKAHKELGCHGSEIRVEAADYPALYVLETARAEYEQLSRLRKKARKAKRLQTQYGAAVTSPLFSDREYD